MDYNTTAGERGRFARLAVTVDLNKPLLPFISIDSFVQAIKYEGLENICFHCGVYGHSQNLCGFRQQSGMEKSAESSEGQVQMPNESGCKEDLFGPWMVAPSHKRRPRKSSNTDQVSDIPRFRTLELSLQSCLLSHLADLIKLFSGSRLEKLLDELSNYFSSLTTDQMLDSEEKSSLRSSCWKCLDQCLDEAISDSLKYIKNIERCMEVIFSLLPSPKSSANVEVNQSNLVEWSEAVRCLAKARQGWLLEFLHVSHLNSGDVTFAEVLKRIQAKAKLVRTGSIPMAELGKSKSYLLNSEPLGTWGVLIEVVATLQHVEGSVKRQWLVDAVGVSSYPSTALQFIGLLSGSCCKYMPLLIADRSYVLNDLPVTLTSLLSDPNWEVIAESFTSYLLTSTERIYSWAMKLSSDEALPGSQAIDESENGMAQILLPVMHLACVCLKHYLPLDKQLRLANMVVD
ncbi:protein RST1-like [Hibiscus syriacus]|uniref:protein RST1-like n=1 Tax=Hibiscus syriacus TaxID=106335 RepID=UPI00192075B0|nr:protein RST1-like [Hibiscus syriacus]